MFCGIVQGVGEVQNICKKEKDIDFTIGFENLENSGFKIGDSIAINGVCLTIRKVEKSKKGYRYCSLYDACNGDN